MRASRMLWTASPFVMGIVVRRARGDGSLHTPTKLHSFAFSPLQFDSRSLSESVSLEFFVHGVAIIRRHCSCFLATFISRGSVASPLRQLRPRLVMRRLSRASDFWFTMLGGPMSANLVVPFGWYSAVAAAQLTFLRFIFVIFPASASSKLVAAVLRLLSRTLLSLEGGAAAPRVEILVQSGRLTVAVLTAAVLLPSPPFVSPAQRPQEVVAVEVVSISVSAAVLASILVSGAASLRRRCGGGFSEAVPVP